MRCIKYVYAALIVMLFVTSAALGAKAKNVIIMIADGWDFNQIAASSYYTGKKPVYTGFNVHYAVSTFSASGYAAHFPGARQGYDPQIAWISDGNGGLKPNMAYFKAFYGTDSSSAATAIATGTKTLDGYVNFSVDGKPLVTIGRLAKLAGKSSGSISSVEWSHATPAVFGDAHNISRGNYSQIAQEMINSNIDVIMGSGNPAFDDNGKPASKGYEYVGGEKAWKDLVAGKTDHITLLQSISDFKRMARTSRVSGKYIGTFQTYSTLQQARSNGDPQQVHMETYNKNVPSLALMSHAALNILSKNPKGFFLMIEGGAVDWANHANQKGRVIEEMISYNNAVAEVVKWVEKNGGWKENLLIVTGDHDSGFLLGPNGATNVVDKGVGNIPDMSYNTGGHSNMLIPLFAKGTGSELFQYYVNSEKDPVRGSYIDNTSIFRVMKSQIAE